jgi:hypothetical protein
MGDLLAGSPARRQSSLSAIGATEAPVAVTVAVAGA